MTAPTSLVETMRRFCVDWLDGADATVCETIMAPQYRVEIGGIVLDGREVYVPATLGQLTDFPGLRIVVHEFATNGEQAMLRFTEHGPSLRHAGARAAWSGIGLFWADGGRLVRNVTEEDYHSRRAQLARDHPDPVPPALGEPWSTVPAARDAELERAARAFLGGGGMHSGFVEVDDQGLGPEPVLAVRSTEVTDIVSAGDRVGARIRENGPYRGGLGLPESAIGRESSLSSVVMLHPTETGFAGHAVRDRAGLRRRLAR